MTYTEFRTRTCQFCKRSAHSSRLVKYSVRHYAHASCYAAANKDPEALMEFPREQFWRLLREERSEATFSATEGRAP